MSDRSDKLLLLDLDETLIHARHAPLSYAADFQFDAYHVYSVPGWSSSCWIYPGILQ